jgi:hypothetical protein
MYAVPPRSVRYIGTLRQRRLPLLPNAHDHPHNAQLHEPVARVARGELRRVFYEIMAPVHSTAGNSIQSARPGNRRPSGIGRTALELHLESGQALAPEGLHAPGRFGVGEPLVLEGHGALRLALRREPDVDPHRAVAPVEAG